MKRSRFWVALLCALLLIAVVPQFFSTEVFRRRMHHALQRELSRPAEFNSVRITLVPRPGVVAERLVLHEDPAFGAEPFLYVEELRCYLPLSTLWTWRVACSRVHLIGASINLVRNADGAWNLGAILAEPLPSATLRPVITVVGGRLNFKAGNMKRRYALSQLRIRFAPASEETWEVQLTGRPLRTDQSLDDTGQARLRGEIVPAGRDHPVAFRLEGGFDRGSLEQLAAFATGREAPVRADASFQLEVQGTTDDWSGNGTFSLADLRRWDLLAGEDIPPWESDFEVRYSGGEDLLEFGSVRLRSPKSEVELAVRVQNPLRDRQWEVEGRSEGLDLGEWLGQVAKLTEAIPDDTTMAGTAALSFRAGGSLDEWEGDFRSSDDVTIRGSSGEDVVTLEGFHIGLAGGKLELQPMTVNFPDGQSLVLDGSMSLDRKRYPYRLHWKSEGVPVEALEGAAAALGMTPPAPGLAGGTLAVDLGWTASLLGGGEPRWQGSVELREALFQPSEFARPVPIPHAQMRWNRGRLRVEPLTLVIGGNAVNAVLEKRPEDVRWRAQIQADRLSLAALAELFTPPPGFLERLVGGERTQQVPWQALWVTGEVKVEELDAGPFVLTRLDTRAEFRMSRLELTNLRFRAYRGRFQGSFRGDFLETPPRYRLAGNIRRLRLAEMFGPSSDPEPFLTGLLGAEVLLEAAGNGAEQVWSSLSGGAVGGLQSGKLAGMDLMGALASAAAPGEGLAGEAAPSPGTQFQSLAGNLRVADQQVEIDTARLIVGRAALQLTGRIGFDGSLDLDVRGEPLMVGGRGPSAEIAELLARAYRLTGTLQEPRIELVPAGEGGGGGNN